MILGNVAAFGGTLITPEFRQHWWPLASLHVALNIGLLVMELAGPWRRRTVRLGGGLAFASVLCGAGVAAVGAGKEEALPVTLAGAPLGPAAPPPPPAPFRPFSAPHTPPEKPTST